MTEDPDPRRPRERARRAPTRLLVADASTMNTVEQRELRQSFVPRDLDQLVRAINGLRRNNHVYARLTRPGGRGPRRRRVPAFAALLGPLGARTPSRVERRPHPHGLRLGLRSRHRLRGLRLARPLSRRRAVKPEGAASLPSGGACSVAPPALAAPWPSPWARGLAASRPRRPVAVLEARGRARLPRGRARGPLRRLGRPRPPGPGREAAPRPRDALRLVPRHGTARAPSSRAPATRARSSASRAARRASSSTPPSSRSTPWPFGTDGPLYVGTSPDGKVYAVEPGGKATTFFDPKEKYIWALAFDPAGHLLVATGGEGRVYRVDPKGRPTVLLQTAETHILSLAVDARGTVFAGSAPSGILYRIDPAGQGLRPARLALSRGEGPRRRRGRQPLRRPRGQQAGRRAHAPPPAARGRHRPATAEVTVTESFAGLPLRRRRLRRATHRRRPQRQPPRARSSASCPAARSTPSGRPRDDTPHALVCTRRWRARGHREQGQGLPRPRRPLLDPPGHPARGAGHRPRAAGATRERSSPRRTRAGLRARRGPRRARHLRLEGEGHRDRVELGPAPLGRRPARGNRAPGADAQRQHPDSRHHLVRLVRGLRIRTARPSPASAPASCS